MFLINLMILANAYRMVEGAQAKDKKDIKDQQKESQSNDYNPLGPLVR